MGGGHHHTPSKSTGPNIYDVPIKKVFEVEYWFTYRDNVQRWFKATPKNFFGFVSILIFYITIIIIITYLFTKYS